jgi:hypothetical protein
MHLDKPLARLALTQMAPNFIHLRPLARCAMSSPQVFCEPFDLLKPKVVPSQVHPLLVLIQRL